MRTYLAPDTSENQEDCEMYATSKNSIAFENNAIHMKDEGKNDYIKQVKLIK